MKAAQAPSVFSTPVKSREPQRSRGEAGNCNREVTTQSTSSRVAELLAAVFKTLPPTEKRQFMQLAGLS
jgi:hypothetical protein